MSEEQRNLKRKEILSTIYESLDDEPEMGHLRKTEPLVFLKYRKLVGDIRNKNL